MIMKYVYMVRSGENYKIGVATNLLSRIRNLQTSNANPVQLVTAKRTPEWSKYEKDIHRLLKEWKMNGGREWFALKPDHVIEVAILINTAPSFEKNDMEILRDILEDNKMKFDNISGHISYLLKQLNAENLIREKRTQSVQSIKLSSEAKIAKKIIEEAELVDQATVLVRKEGKASTSLLQGSFRLATAELQG